MVHVLKSPSIQEVICDCATRSSASQCLRKSFDANFENPNLENTTVRCAIINPSSMDDDLGDDIERSSQPMATCTLDGSDLIGSIEGLGSRIGPK